MYKAKDMIGKSLVSYASGTILYKIHDVIHDPTNHKVLGFLVDETWKLAKGRHVPFSEVRSIGKDAITIDDSESILTAKEDPDVKNIMDSHADIRTQKVMTEDGEELGKITDFYFNDTGTIEGYELSEGMVQDAYTGKSFLPVSEITKVGEEVVFVPREAIQVLDEQVSGIKGAVQHASDKTKEKFHDTKQAMGQKVGYGAELMDTTVMEPTTRYGQQTKEELPQKVSDVKEKAGSVWDKIKERTAEIKEQSAQQIEEKRIKGALGRPVTRVIFDQSDNVILNTGDLITHEAVDQARQNDALDILLNSVATDKPEFTKDELKAEE